MIVRILQYVLIGGGLLIVGAALYVRTTAMDPRVWHVDPDLGERTGRPNDILVAVDGDRPSPVIAAPPAEVAKRLDGIALSDPKTERIAGSPEEGWVTYVQRSDLMGYPDAISVKVSPTEGGSRVSIWSRSRFGYRDFGVNRARVDRWLAELEM